MTSRVRRSTAIVVFALAAFALVPIVVIGQSASPAVRVVDDKLRGRFRGSYDSSPTFRALVDELERSDIIVHVVAMRFHARPVAGMLTFVHAGGGRRILRIAINQRLSARERAAFLGHELQHAVEVARAPWVTAAASLESLYRRIGYQVRADSVAACFETAAARRAGERVLRELIEAEAASAAHRGASARTGGHR